MANNQFEVTIDPWTFFDFKEQMSAIGKSNGTGNIRVAPSWVPQDDFRRLTSYKISESYYRNASREWMKDNTPDEVKESRREYGDPKTIRDAIISSLLGDDMSFMVSGAEQISTEERDQAAQDFSQKLSEWRLDERFDQKVIECERNAVGLADGVYVLDWNNRAKRPRLTVYNPGFYFPQLDPSSNNEYPSNICIAWEYEQDGPRGKERFVRRLKWTLGIIRPHDEDGFEVPLDQEGFLFDNEEQEDGIIFRDYPWDQELSNQTCYFSDLTWNLSNVSSFTSLFDLSPERALINTPEVDLQLDFIPIIHIPNTVAGEEHYGINCIAQALQIIDDLTSTDTDLQASSATTGSPPIALTGSAAPKDEEGNVRSYGPGTVFETGDGTATMIDTSRSLDALIKYKDSLESRLAINTRVPESLLGKVKPNEVPSGIALTLSFTPHSQLIKEMRLVRADKYRLLLKFVGRMYWYNGELDFPDDLPRVEMIFGSFLPADRQEMSSLVSTLMQTKPPAISLETAVRMLMESGLPIEDAIDEVERIEQRDYLGADNLLSATGDIQAVRNYLKLGPAPVTTVPTTGTEVPPPTPPGT